MTRRYEPLFQLRGSKETGAGVVSSGFVLRVGSLSAALSATRDGLFGHRHGSCGRLDHRSKLTARIAKALHGNKQPAWPRRQAVR
jgi:hypothetical protein